MASMKVAREWAAFGQWESGDVVLSIPSASPLYAAGENDRMVMTQSSEPFNSVLTHGGADEIIYPVQQIDQVLWLDPTTQLAVYGGIPLVAADGTLTWPAGATPPPSGVQYTISGRCHQEFYLFQALPQDRAHYGGLDLPRRVVARRFDLFGR